jgi:hypothetical protein
LQSPCPNNLKFKLEISDTLITRYFKCPPLPIPPTASQNFSDCDTSARDVEGNIKGNNTNSPTIAKGLVRSAVGSDSASSILSISEQEGKESSKLTGNGENSGKAVPQFRDFILNAVHRTRTPLNAMALALLYVSRLRTLNPQCAGTSVTPHRVMLAALILSCKVLYDDTYSNKTWVHVSQGMFSLTEINRMEWEFLEYLRFRLVVTRGEWLVFLRDLDQRINSFILSGLSSFFVCMSDNPGDKLVDPSTLPPEKGHKSKSSPLTIFRHSAPSIVVEIASILPESDTLVLSRKELESMANLSFRPYGHFGSHPDMPVRLECASHTSEERLTFSEPVTSIPIGSALRNGQSDKVLGSSHPNLSVGVAAFSGTNECDENRIRIRMDFQQREPNYSVATMNANPRLSSDCLKTIVGPASEEHPNVSNGIKVSKSGVPVESSTGCNDHDRTQFEPLEVNLDKKALCDKETNYLLDSSNRISLPNLPGWIYNYQPCSEKVKDGPYLPLDTQNSNNKAQQYDNQSNDTSNSSASRLPGPTFRLHNQRCECDHLTDNKLQVQSQVPSQAPHTLHSGNSVSSVFADALMSNFIRPHESNWLHGQNHLQNPQAPEVSFVREPIRRYSPTQTEVLPMERLSHPSFHSVGASCEIHRKRVRKRPPPDPKSFDLRIPSDNAALSNKLASNAVCSARTSLLNTSCSEHSSNSDQFENFTGHQTISSSNNSNESPYGRIARSKPFNPLEKRALEYGNRDGIFHADDAGIYGKVTSSRRSTIPIQKREDSGTDVFADHFAHALTSARGESHARISKPPALPFSLQD